jgi:hypothetical protein
MMPRGKANPWHLLRNCEQSTDAKKAVQTGNNQDTCGDSGGFRVGGGVAGLWLLLWLKLSQSGELSDRTTS